MNIKMTCVFGLAISAMLSLHAADVDHVLVRQLWPWSTDIQVEYELNGVTAPVDLQVKAYKGETEVALPANALKGRLYAIDESGAGTFFIDPVAVFGTSRTAIADFRVSVEAVASESAMIDPLYMILDLVSGEKTYLSKADFLNGAAGEKADILAGDVGRYETDFGKVGPSFNTTLTDVLVWTGVTNNPAFKRSKMVFRCIPAAGVRWQQGAIGDEPYATDANTQRYCTLRKSFWMPVFETTTEQFRIMRGASAISGESFGVSDVSVTEEMPQNYVSWDSLTGTHAVNFTTKYGLTFVLPTEAQWEFACRAGTPGNNINSGLWGASTSGECPYLSQIAWYTSHRPPKPTGCTDNEVTARVGQLKPNAFGLYDMHGNVAEFILDKFDITAARSADEVTDPVGQGGADPINCGGMIIDVAYNCWTVRRSNWFYQRLVGFRFIIPID